ncbi:MAG: Lrp/AsnC ligand binding domain-containing protein [Chloroflexi bacterium]|nr:Lrp/AsnC ligand binding domain-containing protein [Chloroflexota bacterium]
MVTAIVLINCGREHINDVSQTLLGFKGVTEVFSVAGQYDLVAILRVQSNEQIADLVTEKVRSVNGIQRTETLMAFKVFSNFDLQNLFAIGEI